MACECGWLDLPTEIRDLVLSYVPDVDIINLRKVSVQFQNAFQRLICRKEIKLNFSRCYHLREEDLMLVLTLGRDNITSVNINHCYWLTLDCLTLIMKLPKLQELHMIDCEPLSLMLKETFPVGLSALSFSWDGPWFVVLCGKTRSGDEYQRQMFGSLKHLTIRIENERPFDLTYYFGLAVLKYCTQLETLTVLESNDSTYMAFAFRFLQADYPDGLLPKLTKLHLHLKTFIRSPDGILDWIKYIFRGRITQLKEVCLGMASYSLLECDSELTLPCINAEVLPEVYLRSRDLRLLSYPELPAIPKIWMNRKTPKCKVVSFQNLSLKWMSDTSKLMAEIGSQLQELNLKKCQVDINDLVMGLTTISKNCARLTKLDLTLDSSVLTNEDSNNKLLIAVSEFKALKVLYISVGLLSSSKNLPNPKTLPGHQKPRIGTQMEISEDLMRRSGMWRLTQSCVEIVDFRITNDTWTDDKVICESALACISNWKNLKELHLVNIPTLARGCFLPFITKICSQLTNLYLANVCRQGTCRYTRSLIESLSFATGLKDLSIIQDMKFSSMLSKALGKSHGLERMYLQSLIIKPEECYGFIKLLSELPKLVLVWVEAKSTSENVIKSIIKKLNSLRITRPALTYSLENKKERTQRTAVKSYRSLANHWPHVHSDLQCYKTVCKNS